MGKIYKIYLDVCCLNRTLDDLEQFRIRIEAQAVTEIIQNCEILQTEEENSETEGN